MAKQQTAASKPATTVEVNTQRPVTAEISEAKTLANFDFVLIGDKTESNPTGVYYFKDNQALNLLKRVGMLQTEMLSKAKKVEQLKAKDRVILKAAALRLTNLINGSIEPCKIHVTEVYAVVGENVVDINTGEVTDATYQKTGWLGLSPKIEFSAEVNRSLQISNDKFEIALISVDDADDSSANDSPTV